MDIGLEAQKFMLVFFRVIAVLWLVPLLSAQYVSVLFKAGLSLIVAFLLYGNATIVVPASTFGDPYAFLLVVAREVFIGISISFIVRIIFVSVTTAGDIISIQTGFSFARFMDPFTMNQVSILEQIKNLLAIMVFFAVDAHYTVFRALAASFRELPIGSASFKEPVFQFLVNSTAKVFSLGFKIGAPVIVTLFLVELAFGVLSRMIPQVNIFVEGVPVKILIAVTVLTFSLGIMASVIGGLFRGMEHDFLRIMRSMV